MRAPLICVLALAAGSAAAQVAPFDMTPERRATTGLPRLERLGLPAREAATADGAGRRYLLPFASERLAGETASRTWAVYLTRAEAAARSLTLGHESSILTAPEASRLSLTVNDVPLIDAPIRSPNDVSELTAALPPNLLKPGRNVLTLAAEQRHRTDCTVGSTYELWTDIDPARTYLTAAGAPLLTGLDDLRAIGVDASGTTRITLFAPSLADRSTGGELMRLAQEMALAADMPNTTISVIDRLDGRPEAELLVAFGTRAEVESAIGPLPASFGMEPRAEFVQLPEVGSVLVVSGASRGSLAAAVGSLAEARAATVDPTLRTGTWRLPEPLPMPDGGRVDFRELGIASREFSGRRAGVEFQVALPADFFASHYGEAKILLDAAYAPAVVPGSRIEVHVNDRLATTYPINTRGGGMLRKLPIGVTMHHFRPGPNTIRLEAVTLTASDLACLPGATAASVPRFALFDSSRFALPRFARLAERPDLGALAGTGAPYAAAGADAPVPLVMDVPGPAAYSAAATFLARLARSAGRVIPVELVTSGAAVAGRDAVFMGPVAQLPPEVLTAHGLAEESASTWRGAALAGALGTATADFRAQWRESLQPGPIRRLGSRIGAFLAGSAGVLIDRGGDDFVPAPETTLLIAQTEDPTGTATWTLVTAPTAPLLRFSVEGVVRERIWRQLDGRIAGFVAGKETLSVVPATAVSYVTSEPLGLGNGRLILANLMSKNAVLFAGALGLACLVLGLATTRLLAVLGRRS